MRRPGKYRLIEAVCSNGDEGVKYRLCWCSFRGAYIEPVTGQLAEPIVGDVLSWEYIDA